MKHYFFLLIEEDEDIPQAGPAPVIETCDYGHKFAVLPDHPRREGKARCPHCLARGYDSITRPRLRRGE